MSDINDLSARLREMADAVDALTAERDAAVLLAKSVQSENRRLLAECERLDELVVEYTSSSIMEAAQ